MQEMQAREVSSIPVSGRFPRGGYGKPLQYSCLENPMDRGAWHATVYSIGKSSSFHFIAPKELAMPNEYKIYCKEHGIKFQEHTAFNEKVIADADIIYMTRVQKERFSDLMEYERVKNVYILRADMLGNTKPNMRILHPLPRVNEIAYDVDDNPHAYYIQQAQNGLYAREAIICDVLGITLDEVKNDKTIIG